MTIKLFFENLTLSDNKKGVEPGKWLSPIHTVNRLLNWKKFLNRFTANN